MTTIKGDFMICIWHCCVPIFLCHNRNAYHKREIDYKQHEEIISLEATVDYIKGMKH